MGGGRWGERGDVGMCVCVCGGGGGVSFFSIAVLRTYLYMLFFITHSGSCWFFVVVGFCVVVVVVVCLFCLFCFVFVVFQLQDSYFNCASVSLSASPHLSLSVSLSLSCPPPPPQKQLLQHSNTP